MSGAIVDEVAAWLDQACELIQEAKGADGPGGGFWLDKVRAALVSPPTQAGGDPVAYGVYLNSGRFMCIAETTEDDAITQAENFYETQEYHIRPLYAAPIASKEACGDGVREAVIEECARVAERDGSRHDATFSQQTAEWHARVSIEVRVADRIAAALRALTPNPGAAE